MFSAWSTLEGLEVEVFAPVENKPIVLVCPLAVYHSLLHIQAVGLTELLCL